MQASNPRGIKTWVFRACVQESAKLVETGVVASPGVLKQTELHFIASQLKA